MRNGASLAEFPRSPPDGDSMRAKFLEPMATETLLHHADYRQEEAQR